MTLIWRWIRVAKVAVLLPIIAGCPARPLEEPDQESSAEIPRYFPQAIEKDIDLLFMIDDSESMGSKQKNLAANFPNFIEALRSYKLGAVKDGATCNADNHSGCKIPNVRLGVVSSDLGAGTYSFQDCSPGGERGKLHSGPGLLAPAGCPTPKDAWIMYSDSTAGTVTNVQNSTSSDPIQQVKDAFSCIAPIGATGCGFEHQLESTRLALLGCDYNNNANCQTNPGFIRKDAYLGVVFLTDEDDCSARRGDLFDPSQSGLNDPLGPWESFRCTEFGIVCAQKLRQPGVKTNCVPGLDWLQPVQRYTDFFSTLKPPGRTILFAIAAPTWPTFEVILDAQNPKLKASCQNSYMGDSLSGDPALRLAAVVKSFGTQGHYNEGINGSGQLITEETCSKAKANDPDACLHICMTDFTPALKLLGQLIVASLGGQCISAPPLTKAGKVVCSAGDSLSGDSTCKAGDANCCRASCLQSVDCVVKERVGTGDAKLVNKCPDALFDPSVNKKDCGASCPCWRIVKPKDSAGNALCKASADGSPYGLEVMRPQEAEKGTVAEANCAVSSYAWGTSDFVKLDQCQ